MILDGKEMTKDMVISNGEHTLVIRGSNGYEKVITFTYSNPYYLYIFIYTFILIAVIVTTHVTIYIKKRKAGRN